MLELIFQGFFEWIYGLILEAWEFFSDKLIDLMSMDFAYLQTHISILPTIRQSMLAVGWALLIGNLVFQALRSMMAGIGFEAEDPKLLFSRTFVFSFLLLASPQICDICLDMTSTVIGIMKTSCHAGSADCKNKHEIIANHPMRPLDKCVTIDTGNLISSLGLRKDGYYGKR